MTVKLSDIAKRAGVSMMSVSRAVNNKAGLSGELRTRILNIADEMGYVPNRLAADLCGKHRSMTVGVIVPHIRNTIFPLILESIEKLLSENGYRIFLCCSYNNPIKEFHDISALLERQVDGIIRCPATLEESLKSAKLIRKQKCPLILMDRILPDFEADSVTVDDYQGAYSAVSHLIALKRRKIAHLTTANESWVAAERLRGYRDALREAGIKSDSKMIIKAGSEFDDGIRGMEKLLEHSSPDALFCFNDPLALGAGKYMRDRGIAIPDQIALIGFSSTLETEIAAVPLSTVFQDAEGLGRQAALALLSRLYNPSAKTPCRQQVLCTHLVIRESTAGRGI